ncbi:MAG: hypothetical protein KGQ60_19800, partial [Planctomycetes bacterium]|nr:hypothetical protein [Planctomycetota bacterium]
MLNYASLQNYGSLTEPGSTWRRRTIGPRFKTLEKWTKVPFQSCATAHHSKGKHSSPKGTHSISKVKYTTPL